MVQGDLGRVQNKRKVYGIERELYIKRENKNY